MSGAKRMFLGNGADWVRADFHLHTIKEKGESRKKYRAEFRDREDEFADEFIAKLESENIKVAVITNHNSFDLGEYKSLAKKGRKKDILILPGIELGLQGGASTIHTLVVFDPKNLTTDNDFINSFLIGQFPTGTPNEGDATESDFVECLNKLEALKQGYFVVFAHVESDCGLLKELKQTVLNPIYRKSKTIWDERVLGFQGVKSEEQNWIQQKLPSGMPIPAKLEGSDPRDSLQEVGNCNCGECYLKLSELSFNSVRFALRDHQLRVRGSNPLNHNRPIIHGVEIQGGKRSFAGYPLSENLNTLIGSRGSGKSLMIEALRWCLNIGVGEGDKDYKSKLVHVFLDRGATVKVFGNTAESKPFIISRSYTGKKEQPAPQVSINGEILDIEVDSVIPGILYFGQKDLGTRDQESTDNIFDQLLPSVPDDLSNASMTRLEEFNKAIDVFLIAKKAEEQDDELKHEENTLTERLNKFKELGVEDRLKEITEFDQDLRRLKELYSMIQKERNAFKNSIDSVSDTDSWSHIFQSEHTSDLIPELTTLFQSYQKAKENIALGISEYDSIEKHIVELGQKLNAMLKVKQDSFAAILKEVNHPDLDIDDYRKMVSRLAQIKETRSKTADKKGKLTDFEKDLVEKGQLWIKALKGETEFYNENISEINDRLPKEINIRQTFQGDKESFREFLEDLFEGSGFTAVSHDTLLELSNSGLDLFIHRKSIIRTLTPKMSEKFSTYLNSKLKEIVAFSPLDERSIEYEGTLISELSMGKRAMALLLLLLSLKTHPIIILDQPEDDLDNETIHGFIVKPLVENKDKVQFVIATHNPNIPVLGDAEQVIACFEDTKGQYREEFGSLDRPETKNGIINIMEGGEDAFGKRHDIYTLWAKPN